MTTAISTKSYIEKMTHLNDKCEDLLAVYKSDVESLFLEVELLDSMIRANKARDYATECVTKMYFKLNPADLNTRVRSFQYIGDRLTEDMIVRLNNLNIKLKKDLKEILLSIGDEPVNTMLTLEYFEEYSKGSFEKTISKLRLAGI